MKRQKSVNRPVQPILKFTLSDSNLFWPVTQFAQPTHFAVRKYLEYCSTSVYLTSRPVNFLINGSACRWVVILPIGARKLTTTFKLELAVYSGLQVRLSKNNWCLLFLSIKFTVFPMCFNFYLEFCVSWYHLEQLDLKSNHLLFFLWINRMPNLAHLLHCGRLIWMNQILTSRILQWSFLAPRVISQLILTWMYLLA